MFFGTRGSYLGPECHFRLPRGVFLALWVTWGYTVAPVSTLLHFGVHFHVFLILWGTLGLQFGTPGRHFGDLGLSF